MNLQLPEVVAIVMAFIFLARGKWLGLVISELARGGPRPPTHPIPGDDSRFLTRKRVQAE